MQSAYSPLIRMSWEVLQRVLCAMSICCSPLWLLADEPTKGLDETACGVVYENLQKIKTSQSPGMLIITHDLQLARSICADIAVMYAGQIVEYGPQVLTGPRHPYTQASWQHCRKTAFSRCLACRHYRRIICPAVGLRRAAPAVKNAVCRKSLLSMTAAPRK